MPLRAPLLAVTVLVAAGAVVCHPVAAEAAAYRYWTYWQADAGGWHFATAGPASTVPADGAVEGWRFAVTTAAGGASAAPGIAPSFDAICGSTPSTPGSKRVALVVDSGPSAIAPAGQEPPAATVTCVVAPVDANGYAVLRSVAEARTENGLICAIAGYPAGECAPAVDDALATAAPATAPALSTAPVPSTTPAPSTAAGTAMAVAPAADSGSGTPWITVAVLTVVVGIGLLLWARRRHG